MFKLVTFCSTLARDETGGEVLEYVLVAGAVILAALAVIIAIGGKTVVRWTVIKCNL